jgi:hypothetical protein
MGVRWFDGDGDDRDGDRASASSAVIDVAL